MVGNRVRLLGPEHTTSAASLNRRARPNPRAAETQPFNRGNLAIELSTPQRRDKGIAAAI
jgi:hypothetical protein